MACRLSLPLAALACSLGSAACSRAEAPVPDAPRADAALADAIAGDAVALGAAGSTGTTGAPLDAGAPPDAAPPPAAPLRGSDGGAPYCRVLRGPIELPLRGPAVLAVRGDRLEAVLDDDGRPRLVSLPAAPAAGTVPARESAEGGSGRGLRIPCAVAGDAAFCPDKTGAVHRALLDGSGDRIVASARAGTRVSAALLSGTHPAYSYIASRTTSEGWVSEAWLGVDDDAPQRFSEDGSGATSAELVPRGPGLVGLYVDARVALTALHARPVTFDHGPKLGEDAVAFVGGPGDRRTGLAAALPPAGPGWALLPIARDISTFGLAVVRLDEPPRVDEPVVWSMYPNGLDPAPVAAVLRGSRTWAARVRPQAASGTARVLELGEVAADGSFVPRDAVPTGDTPSDVKIAAGPGPNLWIAWVDASGSWLESLACP